MSQEGAVVHSRELVCCELKEKCPCHPLIFAVPRLLHPDLGLALRLVACNIAYLSAEGTGNLACVPMPAISWPADI